MPRARLLTPARLIRPLTPSTCLLSLVAAVYEGTSNIQMNTIAKIVSAKYR
jgi:hypothetical protein